MRLALIAIASMLMCSPAAAEVPDRLLVVGDSISSDSCPAEITDPPGSCWPQQLDYAMRQAGTPLEVRNLSSGGARALDWATFEPHGLHATDHFALRSVPLLVPSEVWAVIMLGINDAFSLVPVEDYESHMMSVTYSLLLAGVARILLVSLPTSTGLPAIKNTPAREAQAETQIDLCDAFPVVLTCLDLRQMPVAGNFRDMGTFDDVHPTAAGSAEIATQVRLALEAM